MAIEASTLIGFLGERSFVFR